MPDIRSYLKQDVPREIACQIRSGIRFVWPQINAGWTKIIPPPPGLPVDRRTFVLMDDELLVSHAEANIRPVEHGGETYRVGGLSAVFTYPGYRGSGAGERVVSAASDFLRGSLVDFALLFCGERVKSLYLRTGWEHRPRIQVSYGDVNQPVLYLETYPEHFIMSMMLSDRAKAAAEILEGSPIYVGANTW